ncbi:hypothetical protein NHQ30_000799 [Ciborinia camelliae]|nr:hypothetical protein NHQ30_000799 [Ciborinia camelliae]
MSLHMSRRLLTSDKDDEPIYFTPTYEPEDLICEGSDTEANPRVIIEKRRRYEQCAERLLRGQLPVIESARLRGPFHKDNKNEWVNPWRHREGAWWRPGSKDMLFRREDVMRRAREHGRKDMSPPEALAWCRRDARRQAKEMGIDDSSDMERESATRPDSEGFLVDETTHAYITIEERGGLLGGNRSLIGPPLPEVTESTFPTLANIQDFDETPIIGGSVSDKEDCGRQPEIWNGIKRSVDIAWLKVSHASRRARWEDPAVSSPTPLPHATNQKFQHKVKGTMILAQNQMSHIAQPRSGLSLETPQQEIASLESYASLQQPGTTFTAEASFHTNIGQQGQQWRSISAFESGRKPANLYEDFLEPYSSIPLHTPAGKQASVPRRSATKPVTSPRLPSHPRITMVNDENHETPGNISFVTDVAPSSVNLEHFNFRKRRRRKTNPPEITGHLLTAIGEDSQMPSSEVSKPNLGLQSHASLLISSIQHPIEKAYGSSIRRTKSAMTNVSSHRSSRGDESWLTTQEEVEITPSTMGSDSRRTIKEEYSPRCENNDNSWVTTQDDVNQAPTSSSSMDITQIYRSSNFLPQPNIVEHMEASKLRKYKPRRSLQLSPLKQPSAVQFARPHSKSSPHLPTLLKQSNKSGMPMPYNNLEGSSTQSYNTSPVSSIKSKLKSPQTRILPQNLGSSQRSPNRIATMSNKEFIKSARDDNHNSALSAHVQKSDDSKGFETKETVSEINIAYEDEQIEDIAVLHVNQELHIDVEYQVDLAASEILGVAKDSMQGLVALKVQEVVQEAMQAGPGADDVPNSALSSGRTSTSSSPARTNNLTIHNLISIQKSGSVDHIPKSSMSNQYTPLLRNEEDALSPASTQDLTEYLLEAATKEKILAIPSEDTGSLKVLNPDLQSNEQAATCSPSPQSPWVPGEEVIMVAPKMLTTTEMAEPHSGAESPNLGWQKEEHPVTPDHDIIKPFRDLMTPSPPPEEPNTPEIEQRPSNTQLLVEAATQNPWVNGSKKRSTKRKRVSFGVLEDEDPVQSQPSSQRQRRSPSPESIYRKGVFGSKVAEFDDEVTDINSFQNHFSAIRRKLDSDDIPKINSSAKRPSAISKYKTTLSGAANHITSSPAIDAMAEAFIAADRDSSRERERRLVISPSRNRKPKRKSYTAFEDEDREDSGLQSLNSHLSRNTVLNETSSNAKLGDHTPDYFDEVEDFLGGDWSVEGELKKATSTEFEMTMPKGEGNANLRRSLFVFENVWS